MIGLESGVLLFIQTLFSQGYMFRSAFLKRVPLFLRNLAENVTLCLLAAAVESTSKRVLETVVLDWRKMLTDRHPQALLRQHGELAAS